MTESLVSMLRTLRDVEGVAGSFVWGKSGAVLARDLPAYIDDSALDEVGPRIARIYEAFEGAGDELDGATLVFAEHKLHLREFDAGFVAVLSGPQVNLAALKMAVHVVGRNVCGELERMASEPPAAIQLPSPSAPEPDPPKPRRRFWRIRRS
jgi:predicted regulator of Ras-like GTPase activity (Roadblock/LC7/MglB family)